MSSKIPSYPFFIAQFVISALVFFGGNYVLKAGSNMKQAAVLPPQFSIRDVPSERFSEFKTTILRPEVRRICMQQVAEQFAEKPASFATDFCECYVERVTDAVTQDDMVYLEQFKQPTPEMENRMEAVRQSARERCSS